MIIKPEHLPRHIFHSAYKPSISLKNQIENYEKMIINAAIERNNSIRKAAKELDIHHTTLLKKLQRWKNKENNVVSKAKC